MRPDGDNTSLAGRRVAAGCTTAELWELVGMTGPRGPELSSGAGVTIANELLDRGGPAAVARCEALEDRRLAGAWTDVLLEEMIGRDRSRAQEMALALPADFFGEPDRLSLAGKLVEAAVQSSADDAIATIDALKGWHASSSWLRTYAKGFDFQKVMDHLVEGGPEALAVSPAHMADAWASRSPLEAINWLLAHPDFEGPVDQANVLFHPGPEHMAHDRECVMSEIVNSESPERREALLRVMQYCSPEERAEVWSWTGFGNSVDPKLAEIAAKMGEENVQIYIARCLESSRGGVEEKATGWAQIPAELREPAVAKFLAEWTEKDPTPVGDKARAHWQASFDKACGK